MIIFRMPHNLSKWENTPPPPPPRKQAYAYANSLSNRRNTANNEWFTVIIISVVFSGGKLLKNMCMKYYFLMGYFSDQSEEMTMSERNLILCTWIRPNIICACGIVHERYYLTIVTIKRVFMCWEWWLSPISVLSCYEMWPDSHNSLISRVRWI